MDDHSISLSVTAEVLGGTVHLQGVTEVTMLQETREIDTGMSYDYIPAGTKVLIAIIGPKSERAARVVETAHDILRGRA